MKKFCTAQEEAFVEERYLAGGIVELRLEARMALSAAKAARGSIRRDQEVRSSLGVTQLDDIEALVHEATLVEWRMWIAQLDACIRLMRRIRDAEGSRG